METDELDRLLRVSDPAGELTPDEQQLTADLVAASRPLPRRRRRWALALGAAVAVLIGGGGLAVAEATGIWKGWEREPLAIVHYQLPSGAMCEYRIGNLKGASPEVEAIFREGLANAEVDEAEVFATEQGQMIGGDSGIDDDTLYGIGVHHVIFRPVETALRERGLYDDVTVNGMFESYEGVTVCE